MHTLLEIICQMLPQRGINFVSTYTVELSRIIPIFGQSFSLSWLIGLLTIFSKGSY